MLKILILLFILSLTENILAEETVEPKEGPCQKVIDACKAADFAKGDPSMKKSLYKDCMQPLLAAPSVDVPGVKIDSAIIAACKKIKESKLKK